MPAKLRRRVSRWIDLLWARFAVPRLEPTMATVERSLEAARLEALQALEGEREETRRLLASLSNDLELLAREHAEARESLSRGDHDLLLRIEELAKAIAAKESRQGESLEAVSRHLAGLQEFADRCQPLVDDLRWQMAEPPYSSDPEALTLEVDGQRVWGFRTSEASAVSPFYVLFEDLFRGSSELIRTRQQGYVELLTGHAPVADLGCGRGEMLDLLAAAGASAFGVDHDSAMAELCSSRGHEVKVEDVVGFLAGTNEGELGAIFSAQVIEHLPFAKIRSFFHFGFRALKPDGLMIVETVNPHCFPAYRHFYLDPTHEKPLYPETLLCLARATGFASGRILFPSGGADPQENRLQQGEYALVATKGAASGVV